MASPTIHKIASIDLNNLTFSQPDYREATTVIYAKYNSEPFFFETPDLLMVDDPVHINNQYVSYEMLVTLQSKTQENTNSTVNFFNNLDQHIQSVCQQHMSDWPLQSGMRYKLTVRDVDDQCDYYKNGIIKVQLIHSRTFQTKLFNNNRLKVPLEQYQNSLKAMTYVRFIFEVVSIWIRSDTFGVYLRPYQVKVTPYETMTPVLEHYSFQDTEIPPEYNMWNDIEIDTDIPNDDFDDNLDDNLDDDLVSSDSEVMRPLYDSISSSD